MMSWLVGIAVVIAFLWCLSNFPKQTLGLTAIIAVTLAGLYYVLVHAPEKKRERLEAQIKVSVEYNVGTCGKTSPLVVLIVNESQQTINRFKWEINAYRPGYSSELTDFDNYYSTDKIIAPQERWQACYRLPRSLISKEIEPAKLDYRISSKSVWFAD